MKIIMISLDTLRASHLGCYGHKRPTSPHLDQIAAQGVLFEQAYASDIPTEAAHTSIFTGRFGLSTGIVSHGSNLTALPKTAPWLPQLLKSAGFTTAAVDNLYHLQEWFARGYRYYINTVGNTRWIDGRTVNDLALPWIREHRDESFFLFLHYWDPHTPYLPPKKYISEFYDEERDPFAPGNRSMEPAFNHPAYPFFKYHHFEHLGPVTDADYINALYEAEIRYLDDLLRELDEHLYQLGIQEETLLVLFGDHGESLTEHDIYWDHCGLYEPTVHIPLIMRWPSMMSGGQRVSGFVQHVDLLPTIVEAVAKGKATSPDANVTVPALPQQLDGRSLWPLIKGEVAANVGTTNTIYMSECAWQAARAIRKDRYKLIRTIDSGLYRRPPRELYDLVHDPGETINLADSYKELADELEAELNAWVVQKLAGRPDPMKLQLEQAGLPFRRRIEKILDQVGIDFDDWMENPGRNRFDAAFSRIKR